MTYGQKSVSARLDGLVEWTGIPRLAKRRGRPRPQRWSSVLTIALASVIAGICWMTDAPWKIAIVMALLGSIVAVAAVIREIGPLRAKRLAETEDERENLWRSRSRMAGFAVVATVALIGVAVMAFALLFSEFRNMAMRGNTEINALSVALRLLSFGQYLLVLLTVVPTLHASWTMPPPIEEDER